MKLRFTKQARLEFLHIVDVFAEYAGQRSADKFIETVNRCGEQLCKHPYCGPLESLLVERHRQYRSKAINENYRIIYHVTSTTIWIVDIWDRRRDPFKLANRIKG